jgi:hypothetical protein
MTTPVQYDPAQNVLVIGGVEINDYAAGTAIEITPGGELSTIEKGGRGNRAVTKKHETDAELKITLVKGSPTCKYIGTLFWKYRTGQPLVLPVTRFGVTMQFKNTGSGSIATADNLTPKAEAPMVGAEENGALVFTFNIFNYLPRHDGG